jgi:condensin complex subunit 2
MPPAAFHDDNSFDGDFGSDDGGFGDGDFHAATEADFGKGEKNWADGSIMGDNDDQGYEALTDIKGASGWFAMALSDQKGENMLSYFDEREGKNWAGPEHWRIQRIKVFLKSMNEMLTIAAASDVSEAKKSRKENEVFEIDFFAIDDFDEDVLFATHLSSKNTIEE